jgi:hypothetical protein
MAEMVENEVETEVKNEEEATIPEVASLPTIEEEAVITKAEEAAPKKKGRPAGAKSKVQGKPRAKRKVTIDTESVEVEVATDTIRIDDETLPRAIPNSQPIPRFSHDERSALMLQLLTQQAAHRKRQKVDLWKSWFK